MPRRWCFPLLALALAAALSACAAKRPILYPNAQLQQVGPVTAERDIDQCMAAADSYGASATFAAQTAASTARAAATGAAAGAAAGAVWGRPGRGAATGAAGSAAAGFMRGLFRWREPDAIKARYVSVCLGEMGYQTIGWR